jgi:hypothetical protein
MMPIIGAAAIGQDQRGRMVSHGADNLLHHLVPAGRLPAHLERRALFECLQRSRHGAGEGRRTRLADLTHNRVFQAARSKLMRSYFKWGRVASALTGLGLRSTKGDDDVIDFHNLNDLEGELPQQRIDIRCHTQADRDTAQHALLACLACARMRAFSMAMAA